MNAQIQSFTSNQKYDLTICSETGTAVDCRCPDQQRRGHRADHIAGCKHMRQFNAEIQKAATFILLKRQIEESEQERKREVLNNLYNVNNIY